MVRQRCFKGSLFLGMTKLLVAGGASDETTFLTTVEIVNLDDSTPDVTCQNLPDLPASIFGAAGKSLFLPLPIMASLLF